MTIISKCIGWQVAALLAVGLASAADAKTLVYCSEGDPEGFDPAPFTLGATFEASSQAIYDRLVAFKPGTTEVAPSLAESWDISADGLEYTFHLRPGVKFQATDGFTPTRDFNADDVVFTFERQWKSDNPYFDYAGGIWPFFTGMSMPAILKEVKKVDDQTVVFTLNRPEAPLLADLAMDFASIVSQEYADALRADGKRELLNEQPVGTGPFRLVDYQKGSTIKYEANPDYWNGKPAVDSLVFDITPDASVRMAKLKSGACDVIGAPPAADIAALPADSKIKALSVPGANVTYLAYNTTQAPFDRVEVRKALNMAIDRQAIIDTVFQGEAAAATTPIPPSVWSYDDAIAADAFDPKAARKMLADAGVSGLSMKIWALPSPRPYNPDAHRTAELIQADLAAVGVKSEIVSQDLGEFLKRSADPKRDGAVVFGWTSDNGDPDNFLSVLLGCDAVGISNRAEWCDQHFDKLVRDARSTPAEAERSSEYKEAQAIFADQAPWFPIAHATVTAAVGDRVTGFVVDPLGRFRFDRVDVAGD
jgi:dipeptide transport system substrate-binding protein